MQTFPERRRNFVWLPFTMSPVTYTVRTYKSLVTSWMAATQNFFYAPDCFAWTQTRVPRVTGMYRWQLDANTCAQSDSYIKMTLGRKHGSPEWQVCTDDIWTQTRVPRVTGMYRWHLDANTGPQNDRYVQMTTGRKHGSPEWQLYTDDTWMQTHAHSGSPEWQLCTDDNWTQTWVPRMTVIYRWHLDANTGPQSDSSSP